MAVQQRLAFTCDAPPSPEKCFFDRLDESLSQDLDFHNHSVEGFTSHNFHSFPAKFPPQLPRKFLLELTEPGDTFLDPMMGSGTAVVEALMCERFAIGMDIDPLAVLISRVKTTPFTFSDILAQTRRLIENAKTEITENRQGLEQALANDFDIETRKFIDYWFASDTQIELLALKHSIQQIENRNVQSFFELSFSSIIITKTGGVSLALDLGHTRPHRAKFISGLNTPRIDEPSPTTDPLTQPKIQTKNLKSALDEFEKRIKQNIKGMIRTKMHNRPSANILFANSQAVPLGNNSIDLIVTSPPYASNAIDYMRAHKFSLVWMGYSVNQLGKKRKEYIGSEGTTHFHFEPLPPETSRVIEGISALDPKKGHVLHRYYSEMTRSLKEMYRILKPGKAAIVVVGNSVMRGRSTETAACLADIGASLGFSVPRIGIRNLDRNKRMMPAGTKIDLTSQIQQRMHQEYVIGFYKPEQA